MLPETNKTMSKLQRGLLLLCLLIAPLSVQAHKASDSFLYIDEQGLRLDIALLDAQRLIPLDANQDGAIGWGELSAAAPQFAVLFEQALQLRRDDKPCAMDSQLLGISEHSDGPYAVWQFASDCLAQRGGLSLDYQLLFDIDPLHRGLYALQRDGKISTGVLSPSEHRLSLTPGSALQSARHFFVQGMVHLLLGYDHILFLLTLLLPVALRGDGTAGGSRSRYVETLWIVSAFTLAHSITLTAASLSWLSLPSRPVEIVIALSIALAAVLALRPQYRRAQLLLASGFGLIHGFGFASVLGDLIAVSSAKALALLSFNLGIEVAQIALVILLMPLLMRLRGRVWYEHRVYPGALLLIAALGGFWAWQRIVSV